MSPNDVKDSVQGALARARSATPSAPTPRHTIGRAQADAMIARIRSAVDDQRNGCSRCDDEDEPTQG